MNSHLVLLDFDGTIANTFKDSPSGMNVGKASKLAIGNVFGRSGMLALDEIGGLKNREPGELVKIIQGMTRETGLTHNDATEHFVEAKLSYLIPEISPVWPELYPGAAALFRDVSRGKIPVDLAILSSGHDAFIRKAMEANRINMDDVILVSSDVIRQRPMPDRPRYKPHSYQFAEAHAQWLRKSGILPSYDHWDAESFTGRNYGKPNMIYIGDDPIKDGGLATEARIPFVHVPFTNPNFSPDENLGQMQVENFNDLIMVLDLNEDLLVEDRPFSEIMFGMRDVELFPKLPESEMPYARVVQESVRRMQERK